MSCAVYSPVPGSARSCATTRWGSVLCQGRVGPSQRPHDRGPWPIVAPGRLECLAVFGHHRQVTRAGSCRQSSKRHAASDARGPGMAEVQDTRFDVASW